MKGQHHGTSATAAALCLLFSVLLHGGGLCALSLLPPLHTAHPTAQRVTKKVRLVKAKPKEPAAPAEKEKAKELPFAKTDPDMPERTPEKADFESNRSSRAASDSLAVNRRSTENAPALNGREHQPDEELITFDSERQDGDLQHDGKILHTTPPLPTPPSPDSDEEGSDNATTPSETEESHAATAAPSLLPTRSEQSGGTAQPTEQQPLTEASHDANDEAPRQEQPGKEKKKALRRSVYDPSLADDSPRQAGFRTHERRTRSSGNFIFGKNAALNVSATPRGAYEAEIYRRVARLWYIACDDHRGDIIPGQITISLRIDKRGHLANMALIKRSGAGISQQAFTFKAIRQAVLPDMPPNVQEEVVGDLLELIFTFHFD